MTRQLWPPVRRQSPRETIMQERVFKLKQQMMLEGNAGADGRVLIDGHTGSMCACNPAAGVMLELLKGSVSQAQLRRELRRRFGISKDRASTDVQEFLQSLSAMGAIEMVAGETQSLPAALRQIIASLA